MCEMSVIPIQPLPPIMTMKEVAEILRCQESTVERYIHVHELKAIQIGRERRIRGEDLFDFIRSRPENTRK
jgi:excisionase family DNA binding protein